MINPQEQELNSYIDTLLYEFSSTDWLLRHTPGTAKFTEPRAITRQDKFNRLFNKDKFYEHSYQILESELYTLIERTLSKHFPDYINAFNSQVKCVLNGLDVVLYNRTTSALESAFNHPNTWLSSPTILTNALHKEMTARGYTNTLGTANVGFISRTIGSLTLQILSRHKVYTQLVTEKQLNIIKDMLNYREYELLTSYIQDLKLQILEKANQ